MKPLYVGIFGLVEALILIIFLSSAALALFILIPGLPRRLDRTGGRLIAQARAAAIFGHSYIRAGGVLYRFSAYENYLVVCLISAQSYAYEDVVLKNKNQKTKDHLVLMLKDAQVVLYGGVKSLEHLSHALRKGGAR